MTDRATCWSVTINNPTVDDDTAINTARQKKGWQVIGQKEIGKEGTPHYQLMVKTPQTRFSAMKKTFPRAHIEIARNVKALETYVNKEDTRVGEIPTSEFYPNLEKYWFLVCNLIPRHVVSDVTPTYEDDMLRHLDVAAARLIRKGYHVETLTVNPQIRSSWKKFALYIHERCSREIDRQTDSQTAPVVPAVNQLIIPGEIIESDGPDSQEQKVQWEEDYPGSEEDDGESYESAESEGDDSSDEGSECSDTSGAGD